MAYTEHLPIYKRAYDLCLWLEQVVRGFSRYHKYSLGSDLAVQKNSIHSEFHRTPASRLASTDKSTVKAEALYIDLTPHH